MGVAQADNTLHEVDHIVAKRLRQGDVQYLIRWKGFNSKDDKGTYFL